MSGFHLSKTPSPAHFQAPTSHPHSRYTLSLTSPLQAFNPSRFKIALINLYTARFIESVDENKL
ncbi:MAG: hypothetical protein J7L88_03820, partial [Thermoplasmata archaeon]|nr:hypothetical protein [Thermoplasmata archaeon]